MADLTVRHLLRLCADGEGPPRTPDGRFPVEALIAWVKARWVKEHGISGDGESYDYNAERGRLTKHQADKTELEAAELRGELIRTGLVRDAWVEKAAIWRGKLLPLPSKLAQRIAPPDRIAEVEAEARAVLYDILNELAGFDGVPARHLDPGGSRLAPAAGPDDQPVGGRKKVSKPRVKRGARKVGNGDR